MNRDPRIPKVIQPILENYCRLTEKHLLGLIKNTYVVGSIALDEFNPRYSDIDFITILNRELTPSDVEHLRNIHRGIEDKYPQWEMSGSYIQPSQLGTLSHEIQPYPHFHDGVLQPHAKNGLNLVTWWELKNHGIAIFESEPHPLSFTVDIDQLIAEQRENLNSYWARWAYAPQRILLLYADWGIQWSVLGVLRQFYTFRESSITTKVRAGKYALDHVPTRWHRLIQEAIYIRQELPHTFYSSKFGRMIDAVRFLRYMIRTCNADFAS